MADMIEISPNASAGEKLLNWVDKGQKPSPAGIADRCRQLRAAQPADCRFVPGYVPQPLASRILPR